MTEMWIRINKKSKAGTTQSFYTDRKNQIKDMEWERKNVSAEVASTKWRRKRKATAEKRMREKKRRFSVGKYKAHWETRTKTKTHQAARGDRTQDFLNYVRSIRAQNCIPRNITQNIANTILLVCSATTSMTTTTTTTLQFDGVGCASAALVLVF